MAESDLHRECMIDLLQTLRARYAGRDDVYVTADLLLFYEPGNPRAHVAPDVMVVFGVPLRNRDHFLVWDEKPPTVVFEITSRKTRREDLGKKRALYLQIGVRELYMFDPKGDYLQPRLCGYQNVAGVWQPVEGPELFSPSLDLNLRLVEGELRLVGRDGKMLLTANEIWRQMEDRERAEAATARAEAEAFRAEAKASRAEAEASRAEAEASRAGAEASRAQAEASRAEAEASRAEAEASRAAAAEEEIARLRQRLADLGA